jgi:type II secretory pathway component HofQ
MIQTGQIKDPNYVLDADGKAHYLFETKTKDGHVEKLFRKHSKHGSVTVTNQDLQGTVNQTSLAKSNKRQQQCNSDDDSQDETFNLKKSTKKKAKSKKPNNQKEYNGSVSPSLNVTRMTRQRYQKEQSNHIVPHH